jgi:hypothetical protein
MALIFLSYSKHNAAPARLLAELLEAEGFSVWWDHDLAGGEEYDTTIEHQLMAADKVVVLWSAASVVSRWVRSEADHAAQKGKLIPILIEDVDIPVAFRLIHFVTMLKLGEGRVDDAEYASLRRALRLDSQSETQFAATPETNTKNDRTSRRDSLFFGVVVFLVVVVALGVLANVWRQVL